MEQMVSAVFDTEDDAQEAVRCLRRQGIPEEAICLGCRTDREVGRKGGASPDVYYDTYYHRTDVSDQNFQDIEDIRKRDDVNRGEQKDTDGMTYVGVKMDQARLSADAIRNAFKSCNGRVV